MDVIVGTYEELILGYKVDIEDESFPFSQYFSDHQHIGCVKAAAISDKGVLATGSTDEVIKLFNLVKNKEHGSLMQHTGSVTDICFKDNHMFTCSEDGTVIVWRAGKWEPSRTLKGHKGAVYSVDVHPSGKMALSVGKDRTLRTWNLITGRCAFTTNIRNSPDRVLWSPEGTRYALLYKMTVDVYDVETAAITLSITQETNICSILFLEESVLVLGGDEGKIGVYDIGTKEELLNIDTETIRVKAMRVCAGDSDSSKFLVTASSDGTLQMWRLDKEEDEWSSKLLSKTNCNFRPTSLAIARHADYVQAQQDTADAEVKEEESDTEETTTQPKKKRGKKRKGNKVIVKEEESPVEDEVSEPAEEEESPVKKQKKQKKMSAKVEVSEPAAAEKQEVTKGKKFKNKKKKKGNTA